MNKITKEIENLVIENIDSTEKSIFSLQKNYNFSFPEAEEFTNRVINIYKNHKELYTDDCSSLELIISFENISDQEKSSIHVISNYLSALYILNNRKVSKKIYEAVEKYSAILNTDELKNDLINLQNYETTQFFLSEINEKFNIDEEIEWRIGLALLKLDSDLDKDEVKKKLKLLDYSFIKSLRKNNAVKELLSICNISIEDAKKYISILYDILFDGDGINSDIVMAFIGFHETSSLTIFLEEETGLRPINLGYNMPFDDYEECISLFKILNNPIYPLSINIICNFIKLEFAHKYNNKFVPEIQKLIDQYCEITKSPAFPALVKELNLREAEIIKEKIEKEKEQMRLELDEVRKKEEEAIREREIMQVQLDEEKRKRIEEQRKKEEAEHRLDNERQEKQRSLEEEAENKRKDEEREREDDEKRRQEEQQKYEEENAKVGLHEFKSSITRGGDAIFPEHIYLDDNEVTWEKKTGVFSKDSKTIPMKNITQIDIETSLIGAKIKIRSKGFGWGELNLK